MGIWFLSAAVRSLRWHFLLRGLANLSTATLYPIVIIGYMARRAFLTALSMDGSRWAPGRP